MSRSVLPFNKGWQFIPYFDTLFTKNEYVPESFEMVSLPHTNQEIPYNYFDETMYQFISCYRKEFSLDQSTIVKHVYIDFEGVMAYAEVYINGHYLGNHKGGYTPFSFNLTPYLNYDDKNIIVVKVDSTERADIPPFGYVVDYLTYGGIYREVNLRIVNEVHIDMVYAKTNNVLSDLKDVAVNVHISNNNSIQVPITIATSLFTIDDHLITSNTENRHVQLTEEIMYLKLNGIENIKLWDIDEPNLYLLKITLTINDRLIDTYETRIGFRLAEFTPDGFFLNGKPLKIRGLNRHQAYPYVGYAMPKRNQKKDADILKYDLCVNTVRTSHYPQSKHFLNRCDEIGLLVFEEIPGWQHIGNEAWKEVACENVREMIKRDFNHPSIVIWGVRINESKDDHDFFLETNRIAHDLDETRPTGGVRCFPNSELLEDVYTMNDFTYGDPYDHRILRPQQEVTGLMTNVPYLVTEFNGHMYPTKRFDQEERLNEHALRHLTVHNAAALDPHKCGAIGWCAFDYNTHFDFGSGDRICYHGVMDMFRIPKFAAGFYKSQTNPKDTIVMEAVTRYARGERTVGGITPLTIFTNCNFIKLYTDENYIGTYYPAFDRYAGIAYPPVIVDKLEGHWGMSFGNMTIIGYLDDKEVIRENYIKNPLPSALHMAADDLTLDSDEIDATRIVIKLVDQVGHELPYTDAIVNLSVEGPGIIIGPSRFALIGGCRGAWIKTTGEKGIITINASCLNLKAETIKIEVI